MAIISQNIDIPNVSMVYKLHNINYTTLFNHYFPKCNISFQSLWKVTIYKKNHVSLYRYKQSESESCSVMSDSLLPHGLHSPWNSLGRNTGVFSSFFFFFFFQGIFPTEGLNQGLLHCKRILYQLSYERSPVSGYLYCPLFPKIINILTLKFQ